MASKKLRQCGQWHGAPLLRDLVTGAPLLHPTLVCLKGHATSPQKRKIFWADPWQGRSLAAAPR
jgi:hypothetical protein